MWNMAGMANVSCEHQGPRGHTFPHVPLYVSDKYAGTTERGLYGDVIAEIDWSVGQILATLQELDLDHQTLVVFTSDNGPWLIKGEHGGSAGPLREGKGASRSAAIRMSRSRVTRSRIACR